MAACPSMAASSGVIAAMILFARSRKLLAPAAGRRGRRRRADRAVLRPHRQFREWRAVGPRHRRALGHRLPRMAGQLPRHPSQLYEAGLEGLVLFLILLPLAASAAHPGPAGHRAGRLHRLVRRVALPGRVRARAGCPAGLSDGHRLVHLGPAAVDPDDPDRPRRGAVGRARGRRSRPLPRRPPPPRDRAARPAAPPHRRRRPADGGAVHGRGAGPSPARLLRQAATRWARPATSPPRRRSARSSAS